ncbi:GxxExxY protein [Flavobacterium sp. PL12]
MFNTLGYGFLEKVYENAILIELQKLGLNAKDKLRLRFFMKKD